MKPTHLGDGVYLQSVDDDGTTLALSTASHILHEAGQVIYLEHNVAKELHQRLKLFFAVLDQPVVAEDEKGGGK